MTRIAAIDAVRKVLRTAQSEAIEKLQLTDVEISVCRRSESYRLSNRGAKSAPSRYTWNAICVSVST